MAPDSFRDSFESTQCGCPAPNAGRAPAYSTVTARTAGSVSKCRASRDYDSPSETWQTPPLMAYNVRTGATSVTAAYCHHYNLEYSRDGNSVDGGASDCTTGGNECGDGEICAGSGIYKRCTSTRSTCYETKAQSDVRMFTGNTLSLLLSGMWQDGEALLEWPYSSPGSQGKNLNKCAKGLFSKGVGSVESTISKAEASSTSWLSLIFP